MSVLSQRNHINGILLLILTTVIWGTSFPLLKQVLPAPRSHPALISSYPVNWGKSPNFARLLPST